MSTLRTYAQAVNAPGTWNFGDLRTSDPAQDTGWTRTALVRDPQGAVLTLSRFTPPGGE